MDKAAGGCSTHLIEGDGSFNGKGLDSFIKQVKLAECGLSYAVVAIMGPQSSGKSTLLNNLFHTNFKEMNAELGRSQTTKGIWMDRCVGIEPCTIVMDIEGSDGSERGEDDTAFEKQSALFALAVSDIVLINMWCHDIGREHAANKPLLKTVFQVMLRLFSPRKTTLMFVIRDKTKTPLQRLEPKLRTEIQKIWDSVPKPEAHKQTPLSDFFNVEVVALPSFETEEEKFKEQVASLRQRFFRSIAPNGLAGDRRGVVPASGFSFSAQQIWEVIKENKDLNLPAHKVMVATVRCEQIANEKYCFFVRKQEWCELKDAVRFQFVPGFGKKLTSMLDTCLSSYDKDATYYEDGIRSARRKELEEKLIQLVQPTYQLMLKHMQSETLNKFKKALYDYLNGDQEFEKAVGICRESFMALFDEQCKDAAIRQVYWDFSEVRDKFSRDIDAEVQTAKLSQLNARYESKLKEALDGPVAVLLEEGGDGTWPKIITLYQETETMVSEFSEALYGFEMDKKAKEEMVSNLKNFARAIVEGKTKEEAGKALDRMKERFTSIFDRDTNSRPRIWTRRKKIRRIAKRARSSSLKLLSVLAASRLDVVDGDEIWDTLYLVLLDDEKDESTPMEDPLASSAWEDVPATKTFITPIQCKSLWSQFQRETEYTVTQAIASVEAYRREKKAAAKELAIDLAAIGVLATAVGIVAAAGGGHAAAGAVTGKVALALFMAFVAARSSSQPDLKAAAADLAKDFALGVADDVDVAAVGVFAVKVCVAAFNAAMSSS